MSNRPLTAALAALMSVSLAAPTGASAQDLTKPSDGVATAAACRTYGFAVPGGEHEVRPTPRPLPMPRHRVQNGATVGPPPPPAPPPPPPPPPPPMAMSERADVVVSASRVAPPSQQFWPGPPPPADTERYPDATPNPVKRVADEPVSTFSIDVDTASYANVRRFIAEGRRPTADAVRVEEMINYFDYGYARPRSAEEPFAITAVVAAAPWASGRQIVHVGLQGYELPAGERRPLNLTFLVDVSGSMQGPDRLALAQKSMNLIIDRLRPQDRVAVTHYASGAGTTLPPVSGDQKLRLRCAVASLSAGGGTGGAQGLANAYDQAVAGFARDRVNRILLFTDGDFNLGVTDNDRLEDYVARKRQTGVYLSIYGYGRGNYQDQRMQVLAQSGNGTAAYVDDLDEARRLFGPSFDRGAFPIADDVKIQVEFNPARVAEYRLIGYETRLLNEEDFANDRVDAGEVGSGASVTALSEITPVSGPSQVPQRRYDANQLGVGGGDPSGEIGFVQVRYKLPGQDRSRLMQRVVSNAGNPSGSTQPPESTRWALAVAAFGQKLRDDPWMPADYGWDQVIEQAQGARGDDPYGERAAFVRMVRNAEGLPDQRRP